MPQHRRRRKRPGSTPRSVRGRMEKGRSSSWTGRRISWRSQNSCAGICVRSRDQGSPRFRRAPSPEWSRSPPSGMTSCWHCGWRRPIRSPVCSIWISTSRKLPPWMLWTVGRLGPCRMFPPPSTTHTEKTISDRNSICPDSWRGWRAGNSPLRDTSPHGISPSRMRLRR